MMKQTVEGNSYHRVHEQRQFETPSSLAQHRAKLSFDDEIQAEGISEGD